MSSERLVVTSETKKQVDQCRAEYLRHHPEMEHVPLSYDKIVYEVTKYYLKDAPLEITKKTRR